MLVQILLNEGSQEIWLKTTFPGDAMFYLDTVVPCSDDVLLKDSTAASLGMKQEGQLFTFTEQGIKDTSEVTWAEAETELGCSIA